MNILRKLTYWSPRALGILISLYISMFAFDTPYKGDTLIYLEMLSIQLIPALLLLVVVLLAWRWEWIGVVSYSIIGVLYITMVAFKRPDWIIAISGPLFLCAVLFALSWYVRKHRPAVT